MIKPRRRSKRVRTSNTIETIESSDSSLSSDEEIFEELHDQKQNNDSFSISNKNLSSEDDGKSKTVDDTCLSFFQSKLIEFEKKCEQLPNSVAKVNAEVEVMTKTLPTADVKLTMERSNKQFVLWTFGLSVEWENETIVLPITESTRITSFNVALQSEPIYNSVVNIYIFQIISTLL